MTAITFNFAGADFSGGGGGAPSAFTPLRTVSFDGLASGQSVVAGDTGTSTPASVSGKRLDEALGNKGFAGGYGMQAQTTVKMAGKTSAMICSIAQGSDGDPAGGDTGAAYGAFGGRLNLDPAHYVAQGDEIWFGFWMYTPAGTDWSNGPASNIGAVKFIRWLNDETPAKADVHIVNGGLHGRTAATQQAGWGHLSEIDASTESWLDSNRKLKLDDWSWVESYIKPHSDLASTVRRLWVDEQFVYELSGGVHKYIDHNGATQTFAATAGETLPSASAVLDAIMLFTYWNGYAQSDNALYIQSMAYHKTATDLTATDQFGNKMMGALSL